MMKFLFVEVSRADDDDEEKCNEAMDAKTCSQPHHYDLDDNHPWS